MRKLLTGAVMVAVLALTGCGVTQSPVPVAPTSTPAPQPPADPAGTFFTAIDGDPYFVGIEGEASDAAQQFCRLAGMTTFKDAFESGAASAVKAGVPSYDYGYLVGVAVGVYCPEFKQAQQEYLATLGS